MRKTSGIKDILTGKAVLLPYPLWLMEEINKRWDVLIKKAKEQWQLKHPKN